MKSSYDLLLTKYRCKRCETPIEVQSESFYYFSGPDDSSFWCPSCEDLPQPDFQGVPAEELPTELQLTKGFRLKSVPPAEFADVKSWNLLYRPFSKRSFLQQYSGWLKLAGAESFCEPESNAAVNAKFDQHKQTYSNEVEYEIADSCEGVNCQFLGSSCLKPEKVRCSLVRMLCDVKGPYGLCETGDEAMILQQYLLLTGGEHFPMLVPQPSILKGKKRPDFICFVPITKFQYHKVVVLVDRPHKDEARTSTEDAEYRDEGFLIRRILVDPADHDNSYFKRARELVLWLQRVASGGG
jgi:hypothetical protein